MPADPIRDALREAGEAAYRHKMPDGDTLSTLIHMSDCVSADASLPEQLQDTRRICDGVAAAAIAAFLRALEVQYIRGTTGALAAAVERAAREVGDAGN